MNKLKMQTRDVVGGNIEKIAALFPLCVTERLNKDGKPELAIDFDKLNDHECSLYYQSAVYIFQFLKFEIETGKIA